MGEGQCAVLVFNEFASVPNLLQLLNPGSLADHLLSERFISLLTVAPLRLLKLPNELCVVGLQFCHFLFEPVFALNLEQGRLVGAKVVQVLSLAVARQTEATRRKVAAAVAVRMRV